MIENFHYGSDGQLGRCIANSRYRESWNDYSPELDLPRVNVSSTGDVELLDDTVPYSLITRY